MPCDPFSPAGDGLRLNVRLTPKASADRIVGIAMEADGDAVLKVAVTAAPENGKANARLLSLLAKCLKVARTDIAIVQGATARRKVLFIRGDADEIGRLIVTTARKS